RAISESPAHSAPPAGFHMRTLGFAFLLAAAAGALAQPPVVTEHREVSAVLRWNDAALAAVKAERTPPPVAARNLAIVHVAMYDAVVPIVGEYRPFTVALRPAESANAEAAAAVAAHR